MLHGQLEPVIYSKDSAPTEVRDLNHMYCLDHNCQQSNICQQGILTPPRHLIPPPVFLGVRVSPFVYLTCNSYLNFETDYTSVSWPFHVTVC
jgi:hypothetical protein